MGPLFVVMTLIEVWLVWSIVGLIYLTITKQSRRPSNVISFVAGGAFFGFVSLLFYGVLYKGLAGPEPLSGGWLLGFFLTVGVATVPPIAWRFMRKHIGEKHDETPASARADA